jgi:hypothetical protein
MKPKMLYDSKDEAVALVPLLTARSGQDNHGSIGVGDRILYRNIQITTGDPFRFSCSKMYCCLCLGSVRTLKREVFLPYNFYI